MRKIKCEKFFIKKNKDKGRIFAPALAVGKLITIANDTIENFSDENGFEFVLFLNFFIFAIIYI